MKVDFERIRGVLKALKEDCSKHSEVVKEEWRDNSSSLELSSPNLVCILTRRIVTRVVTRILTSDRYK